MIFHFKNVTYERALTTYDPSQYELYICLYKPSGVTLNIFDLVHTRYGVVSESQNGYFECHGSPHFSLFGLFLFSYFPSSTFTTLPLTVTSLFIDPNTRHGPDTDPRIYPKVRPMSSRRLDPGDSVRVATWSSFTSLSTFPDAENLCSSVPDPCPTHFISFSGISQSGLPSGDIAFDARGCSGFLG